MCFTRKFVIVLSVILSIPVLLLAYLAGRFQYQLVRSTYTINEIPRSDPVFSSPAYQRHFGDQELAKIESFAVAILLPLEAVLPELSENDEAFASEVFRIMWNERMNTQFNGPPSSEPPSVGSTSASDAIRAEVVDVGPIEMAMTITTVPNGYIGGFEVISAVLDFQGGVAGVMVKYIWHNAELLPRKWAQYIAIWMQLTGRRMWLMSVMSGVTKNIIVEKPQDENEGRRHPGPSSRVEL
ncbi:hypothetical protein F4806DRAFT_479575 [Annulohypoxylon nitens]|nr:hypothetical protein F4806DRAFT_479575 [Annulohypoxylon nitens]